MEAPVPATPAICMTCPFYFPPRGECRALPPEAVLFSQEMFNPDTGEVKITGPKQPTSFFPPQRPDSWCGHHPMRRDGQRFEEVMMQPPKPPDILKGITG